MRVSNRAKTTLSALSFTAISTLALAHQGHQHAHPGSEAPNPMTRKGGDTAVTAIREDYRRRVDPIFQKSCMDCHSSQTRHPWYYKIPGIKQMIDSDVREAKHHLDFSGGYPFKSHATPIEDLTAIAESIQKATMPPRSYLIMHRNEVMTDNEKKMVLDWADKSKALLKKTLQ